MAEPIPYVPETIVPIPGADAQPEDLAPLLQKVEVEVLIADTFDQASKAKLEEILRKTLALDAARGDKVTFTSLGLKVEPRESDVQRNLARSEADAPHLENADGGARP